MVFKKIVKVEICIFYIILCYITGIKLQNSSLQDGGEGYGVWYSDQDLINLFSDSKYTSIPAVRAIVATYQDFLNNAKYDRKQDPPLKERCPFIAIEGTHRDSRIIVGKELANYLQCTYLGNPPRSMVPLRKHFDRQKGMLRKAYFSISMYVGAHHIRETWITEPIVTTGYWLDQAAFSIAQRYTLETLPPPNSPVYQWPEDLVRPDVAFFLNIPQLRWDDRPQNVFKPRLIEVYRRIRGVKIIEINQTGTYRKIFSIIKSHIGKMFKQLKVQPENEEATENYNAPNNNYYDGEYQA